MNETLTALGVPGKVQAYFDADDLLFDYGGHFEHFGNGFHRVPTTVNLWTAGNAAPREIVITSTAMEAIAFLSLNIHRYPDLDTLAFIALGNLPHAAQLRWINARFPDRKFRLVFGNDILGRLADIKVAASLKGTPARLILSATQIHIHCGGAKYTFNQEKLSLNAFEKVSGMRTGCRTAKPKKFITYLDQLKYDATS